MLANHNLRLSLSMPKGTSTRVVQWITLSLVHRRLVDIPYPWLRSDILESDLLSDRISSYIWSFLDSVPSCIGSTLRSGLPLEPDLPRGSDPLPDRIRLSWFIHSEFVPSPSTRVALLQNIFPPFFDPLLPILQESRKTSNISLDGDMPHECRILWWDVNPSCRWCIDRMRIDV